jgi:DNA processing protein
MGFSINKAVSDDPNFPKLLREIPDPPKDLNYLGELPGADEIMVAIVGTRKATAEGKLTAKRIAKDLAEKGLTIVSGLALGIDAAAHEGALAGRGRTVAVLGNGLPEIYPRQHYGLAKKILENKGCIFSEYAPGTPAMPHQFLERNRIVSGLTLATVIVEAPIRSGSMVTARLAIEQGREVLVMPGPAEHPNYRGSHLLIRNGARLVTDAADIMEDLGLTMPENEKTKAERIGNLTAESRLIVGILKDKKSLSIDKIIELTKLETQVVNQELTFLLFDGVVAEKNGKFGLKD